MCSRHSTARVPAKRDWCCPSSANSPSTKSSLHEVEATEAEIADALFGASPRLFCDIAEWNGEPAGFAVWFVNFSTFSGRPGIYLEDLFVRPALRGKGIGKALLVHLASTLRRQRLGAAAMVGARLEHAVDRILQVARRGADGRMDRVPASAAEALCDARARSTMIEIVIIVAVAENGVIGRDNTIPWRLKADQQRLKAMTMGKPFDGAQDLRVVAAAAAGPHQYRHHARCELSRGRRHRHDFVRERARRSRAAMRCGARPRRSR